MHRNYPVTSIVSSSVFLFLLLFQGTVLAQGRVLHLNKSLTETRAQWNVLSSDHQSMRLEMLLPSLFVQDINASGEIWQKLTADHGGLAGQDGSPALPTVSHLIAIPANVMVNVRIIDYELQEINDLRLMPQQPGGGGEFLIDEMVYDVAGMHAFKPSTSHATLVAVAPDKSDSSLCPEVHFATPAIMAGQAVLPLTIGAVSYDPVAQRGLVTSRVEIEISYSSDKNSRGLLSPTSTRAEAGSTFKSLMQDRLLGDANSPQKSHGTYDPGTWAIVCADTAVISHLGPLIQWRARQGYHVEVLLAGGDQWEIKSQLQGIYDDPSLPPLEFIVLAGDAAGTDYDVPTFLEQLSREEGEGDHYYTTLDGDDILADAHVGRLTFDDLAMLDTIVTKITNYEQHPSMDNTDWFRKACVIGDPSASGPSTIFVNQWLKGQLLANNYTAVDTIWGGNFASHMMTSVNQGVSAFGYRGFGGMSGISPSHILALQNGQKLPVAILPTCLTGSFRRASTTWSEAWLKAPQGGAIAAIGTATAFTHTRYNNCIYQGIWDGLLNAGDSRIGSAHTLGKLEIFNNYFLAEPDIAEIWSVWNNLMGDGASQIWQGVPNILQVEFNSQVSVGSDALNISVLTDGVPVDGALVCLYRDGELRITGKTDETGNILLSTPPLTEGEIQVTVTGHDLHPHSSHLQVGTVDIYCGVAEYQIDDDNSGASHGNGDGVLNPGETIELKIGLLNRGTSTASDVMATIGDDDTWVTGNALSFDFSDIPPGGTIWSDQTAVLTIDQATPDGTTIMLPIMVSDGAQYWPSVLQESIQAASLAVTNITWSEGISFEPGQTGQLILEMMNHGSMVAETANLEIASSSPWLSFSNSIAEVGSIGMGEQISNTSSPFLLEIHPSCHPGHLAHLSVTTTYNSGMQTSTDYAITIGTAETDDPTGPDAYGYYAFDNTDASSFHSPAYQWVALDPSHGGTGTNLEMTDFAMGEDETKTINLPFTFRYYGQDFSQVSICTNGWMAMGETPLVHYRNYTIPGKGSIGNMIAPFWDNLIQGEDSHVYYQYDEIGHRFIVQWYMLHNEYSTALQNFEVILLDPAWHTTPTGDGSIIFQYETVNNTDGRNGYATVGIQNHERTNGLLYSYWDQYASGATPLRPGLAIRFHPFGTFEWPVPEMSHSEFSPVLGLQESSQLILQISNTGPTSSLLDFTVKPVDPATMKTSANKDIQGSTVTLSVEEYEPGSLVEIEMAVHVISLGGYISTVSFVIPPGVTLHSAEGLQRIPHISALLWNGETGEGIESTWGDGSHSTGLYNGRTYLSQLALSFDEDLTGDVVFNFRLDEQGGFYNPDRVTGSIILINNFPSLRIQNPSQGTIAIIGQTTDITFELLNASGSVDIALQREPEGSWGTLASSVDASSGSWPWLVSGEAGPHAVIRITDSNDETIFRESGIFVISNSLDWISISQSLGSVGSGQTTELVIDLNTMGLEEGIYHAALVIKTSSGESFTVPVNLTVDTFAYNGINQPRTVALMGNYPNPFNPSTTFTFTLPHEMPASLEIYSARGMSVRRLLGDSYGEGVHRVTWDGMDDNGRAVPSGVYFGRLVTPGKVVTEKVVLTK